MPPAPALVSLPIEYIHMETGVIFLFLAMVVWVEFRRAAAPDYDVQGGLTPLRWLPFFFVVTAVVFAFLLNGVSPLLGIELAIGMALALLHPVNALCFMIHLQFLRPWELEPANPVLGLIPRFGVLLCVFSWLIHSKKHAKLSWRSLRDIRFLIAFAGWTALSIIKAPNLIPALRDWIDPFFKVLIMFGIALFLIESERSVQEFELTLVISSLSLMASGLYQFLTGGMTLGRLKMAGTLADPNDIGAVIVMALPFAMVPVFEETTGPLMKTAGLLYAGLAAAVIWLTRSRGTMLAVVAQFLVVRLARSKRQRLGVALTAVLVGAGYIGLMRLVPRRADDMESSEASRITFWRTAVNMAAHNPILGVGYDQYPEDYMYYAVGKVYERGKRTAHSSWFLALGETGFVGFFFFAAFFISVVRIAWRNRVKRPAQLYAVAGYGVAMSFLSHTYSPYYYLLMALVLASAGVNERAAR